MNGPESFSSKGGNMTDSEKVQKATELAARDTRVLAYKKWLKERTSKRVISSSSHSAEIKQTVPTPSKAKTMRPPVADKRATSAADAPELIRNKQGDLISEEFADR